MGFAMWVGRPAEPWLPRSTPMSRRRVDFDNGEKLSLGDQDAGPETVSATVAARLTARA